MSPQETAKQAGLRDVSIESEGPDREREFYRYLNAVMVFWSLFPWFLLGYFGWVQG